MKPTHKLMFVLCPMLVLGFIYYSSGKLHLHVWGQKPQSDAEETTVVLTKGSEGNRITELETDITVGRIVGSVYDKQGFLLQLDTKLPPELAYKYGNISEGVCKPGYAAAKMTAIYPNTIARIQFRLPDGSSFSNQFPSQSRLQEARHFAVQEVGKRYGNFTLATMFPRREFTSEDLDKTLLELDLAPSASIVLLPQSSRPTNTVIQSSDGGIWAVLGTLLYPLLAVWRFLSSFLFATPPPSGAASRGSGQPSGSYTNSASASDKAKRDTVNKDTVEKRPKDFKKDGKVCRLRTQEDSEDDNNTWNGNSTQQM